MWSSLDSLWLWLAKVRGKLTRDVNNDTMNQNQQPKVVRQVELDLLKTFTIIVCMIPVHVWLSHTDLFDTTFTKAVDVVLGGLLAAPVFMFCMGMGLVYTRHNSPSEMVWRGVKLLTYGAALSIAVTIVPYFLYKPAPFDNPYALTLPSFANVDETIVQSLPTILTVDIMQLAGLSYLLYALLKKLNFGKWTIFFISLVMCFIGAIVRVTGFHLENPVFNHILGLFVASKGASCFPLFTWFIFITAGVIFAEFYSSIKDKRKYYRYLIPIEAFLTTGYIIIVTCFDNSPFHLYDSEESFYGMLCVDAVRILVLIPFLVGIWWLILKTIPRKWLDALSYPARHINQYYCVSWTLICLLMGVMIAHPWVNNNLTLILDSLLIIGLTVVTVFVYNRFFMERWEAAVSKHKYCWIAFVWIVWFGSVIICNL